MVESTTLSHQCVLLNSTNLLPQTQDRQTPSEDVLSKRRPPTPDETPTKRPRLTRQNGEAGDGDTESFIKSSACRHTTFSLLQTSSRRPPSSPRIIRMYPFFVAGTYVAHCSLLSAKYLRALYCSPLYHRTDLTGSNASLLPTILL